MSPEHSLIAVDIGNSRIKVGRFDGNGRRLPLPPAHVLERPADKFDPGVLEAWLVEVNPNMDLLDWWIASVNRPPTERLVAWLRDHNVHELTVSASNSRHEKRAGFHLLAHTDLSLDVKLPESHRVGIDRLLGAVAANRLRRAGRPAVVIDLGSAMTVDLVDANGAFLGGAILPGIGMSARAMHEFTDRLPQIPMEELADPPRALGDSTIAAMRSGLYWGAIGAMKELIVRLAAEIASTGGTAQNSSPTSDLEQLDIFLTGGAAAAVAPFIDARAQWIPDLVLGGIALAART